MFVQYLSGGIGHLEQFPPANNDNEVTYEYDDEEDEMATDESEARRFGENGGGENEEGGPEGEDEEDGGDGEDGGNEEDRNDEDGEDEAGDNEWSDPGESSDEDMGNTY